MHSLDHASPEFQKVGMKLFKKKCGNHLVSPYFPCGVQAPEQPAEGVLRVRGAAAGGVPHLGGRGQLPGRGRPQVAASSFIDSGHFFWTKSQLLESKQKLTRPRQSVPNSWS